jgi:hypothetical protein
VVLNTLLRELREGVFKGQSFKALKGRGKIHLIFHPTLKVLKVKYCALHGIARSLYLGCPSTADI